MFFCLCMYYQRYKQQLKEALKLLKSDKESLPTLDSYVLSDISYTFIVAFLYTLTLFRTYTVRYHR